MRHTLPRLPRLPPARDVRDLSTFVTEASLMITHVQSVTVFVSDQDKAIDFYVNKLGFELRSDTAMGENMRWVTVAPPGAPTEIVLAKGYGDWSADQVGKFSRIVFNAE